LIGFDFPDKEANNEFSQFAEMSWDATRTFQALNEKQMNRVLGRP